MPDLRIWMMAARPRTLPAAVAPVLVGTAAAGAAAGSIPRVAGFMVAMVASILIQIGTNLSNDYSDAKRGADTADRLGPVRVTAAGLVAPRRVLTATWIAFGLAAICGLYLVYLAGWIILVVGIASIAAGYLYTGGPRPYGYAGLGEVFVFCFFGLIAVNGAYYVQLERLDWLPFVLSISVGLLASAILVVNNFRDIDTDSRAGKDTLAVRIGRRRTRVLFVAMIGGAYLSLLLAVLFTEGSGQAWLGFLSAPQTAGPVSAVTAHTDGPTLNKALGSTGVLLGVFSVLVAIGLLV